PAVRARKRPPRQAIALLPRIASHGCAAGTNGAAKPRGPLAYGETRRRSRTSSETPRPRTNDELRQRPSRAGSRINAPRARKPRVTRGAHGAAKPGGARANGETRCVPVRSQTAGDAG